MRRWDWRVAALCATTGVILCIGAATLYAVDHRLTTGSTYALLAGVALIAAYAVLDPAAITGWVRSRRERAKSLSLLVTALVLGIVLSANVLAARSTQAWDVTSGRLNTLAPQSVAAARSLTSDLQVIGLFRPGTGTTQVEAEALITLYQAESSHVRYRRADVDTDRTDVTRYSVIEADTVVLDYNGKTELLIPGSQGEQDFTAALLKLESLHVPMVCWVTGGGERDLKDTNQGFGYSGAADLLAKNNFATKDVTITQATAIPADCDEVALVAPTQALPDGTVALLDAYLAGGGKLLIVAEPWQDPAVTRSMSSVLKPYGLGFSGGLVIESDPTRYATGDPTVPAIVGYGTSPVTTSIRGIVSFFPQVTAITGTPDPSATAVQIATTSSSSYAIERPRQDLARIATDTAGPFTIMETVEESGAKGKTRIVIVGTGAFAENRTLPPNNSDANSQLALDAVEWLAAQDSLVSIPPKRNRILPLALAPQDRSSGILLTLVLVPGLFALAGIGVWWRRRPRS